MLSKEDKKAKHAAYMRNYYATHPEYREYMKQRTKALVESGEKKKLDKIYYQKHHDRIRVEIKLDRQQNPGKYKQWGKDYRKKHLQEIRDKQNAAYRANPQPNKIRARKYRKDNLQKVRERDLLYQKNHPLQYREVQNEHRIRKLNARGKHTLDKWLGKVEYYGWRCFYCACSLNVKTLTKDHAIPLARGGTNWLSNLHPSCKSCNCRKHDKTVVEFLKYTQEAA